MLTFFLFFFVSILLVVTLVQDVRERAVSVVIFPLLWLSLSAWTLMDQKLTVLMEAWTLNVLFLVLQLGALYLYFWVTRRRLLPVIGTAMGWGDLLFWLAVAVYFSLPNFIFFFLGSLVFSLLLHFALRWSLQGGYGKTVPLAGFQALSLLLLLILQQSGEPIDFYDDFLVLEYLI